MDKELEQYLAGLTDKKLKKNDKKLIAMQNAINHRLANPEKETRRRNATLQSMETDEWKTKHKEGIAKNLANPEWRKNNKIANQEKWKNAETKEKHLASVRARSEDPAWLEKVTKNNKAKVNDADHRERHQEAIDQRGQGDWYEKNARKNTLLKSKPVVTPYGVFPSRIVAVKTSGVTNIGGKINKYVKIPDSGYYYISREEYIMLTGKE